MDDASASAGYSHCHMERKMSAMACTVFNELRLEGKLCDVIIKVNGCEFNAHKNILCSCSSYFRALFTSSWNNTEKRVYNIPGITPDMMKLIIEYAYTRTVPITVDNVERLFVAADQFNVMGIVRACSDFMKCQLCLENCIGICKFTEYYYCPDLRQTAYMFILHNFEEMVKASTEFLELSVNEFQDIIEKDELNVKQEDAVFEAILKWITHDPQNRKQHMAVLLPKVRLALMHAEYFMNNVKMHDYVKDSEECKPIIIDALKAMYDLNMNGPSSSDFTNPLTRPRLPYAILFAIGGWSGGSPTNAIETYDARADRWVNVTCQQESPRAYHGAAYLKGYVYIIGGFDSVDYFNSVKRFEPIKKTWHQVAPMHSRRCYVSVTVLENFIYAMGGFDGYVRLNTAERYEPETNQWTLISPMHEQRSDASATTLYGKVYICGGFNGNECLFTAEVFDAKVNQWSLIAPMRSRRSGIGVIAYGDHVYAVGGFDGANRLRSAEAYNPIANTWRTIPTMFNPRSNFGIEVVDDLLFVVGGFNGFTTTFNVECYDEKTDEWYDAHDMSIYRSALSCCVVPGLPNVGEYAARRDNYAGSSQRDEKEASAYTKPNPEEMRNCATYFSKYGQDAWTAIPRMQRGGENSRGSSEGLKTSPTSRVGILGQMGLRDPFFLLSLILKNFLILPGVLASLESDGGWLTNRHSALLEEEICTIERRHADITYAQFIEQYAFSRPVILQGITNNTEFQACCTKENLLTKFGGHLVRLSTANTYSYRKVDLPFQDYVDQLLEPQDRTSLGSETLYFFGDNNFTEWGPLFQKYRPPPFRLPGTTTAYSFGIAGSGSGVPFHWHGPGYSEVIFGRKRWFLYPPEKTPEFHPNKTTLSWLLDTYPFLPPWERPVECTIHPGEVLYFPDHWWHATLNLDTSVFISTFLG